MDWLRDRLPDYRLDALLAAHRAGFQAPTIRAARRHLGAVTEYVPGDKRPWLVIPSSKLMPAPRCRYCGSSVMIGPDCDPS